MTFSTVSDASVLTVAVEGDLDAVSGPKLKALLIEEIERGSHRLIIDLSRVGFIDSSGLGALVSGLKSAKLKGGSLVLAGLQEQARTIFEITMAYRIFDLFPTVEAAFMHLEA